MKIKISLSSDPCHLSNILLYLYLCPIAYTGSTATIPSVTLYGVITLRHVTRGMIVTRTVLLHGQLNIYFLVICRDKNNYFLLDLLNKY